MEDEWGLLDSEIQVYDLQNKKKKLNENLQAQKTKIITKSKKMLNHQKQKEEAEAHETIQRIRGKRGKRGRSGRRG